MYNFARRLQLRSWQE